ncbi:3-deoxy-D-manno-octulosonic acid transferase [Pareuzebyella sediminis]|uniref:3-deoxy-D-manno-octulosonic acid transferase n=1 Tax=Pareuzebyella sediminis TaxID=2607998 RepID=UPI0011EE8AB0|nr:glycosyltransferase N-terminal domain-containing protein [Pareuzebyella sediminis]
MGVIYNLVTKVSWFFLQIIAIFNSKIKLFVKGRKQSFTILRNRLSKDDSTFWVHVASLGEFEQGLPIIEKLRSTYPSYKIVVTFFSPSGYEIKKDTTSADAVAYLPIDSKKNVALFLDIVQPKVAIFVKYEIWPNYMKALRNRHIPTLLVSAIFKKDQIYFKWYGHFLRQALRQFDHYFVQDEASKQLLATIQIKEVSVCGDTRLDRVSEILDRDNALDFMETFKKNKTCFVAGSTWPQDEALLIDYINSSPKGIKYVLAPHNIKKEQILGLAGSITKKKALFSNFADVNVGDCEVLIVDTIGLLTKIYSYADIAYVGGGFKTGLHNTLEPAVFGVPVIIGPNYKGFKEAEELVAQKGIVSISDAWGFSELMKKLVEDPELRKKMGRINSQYIARNKGASVQIMNYIRTYF